VREQVVIFSRRIVYASLAHRWLYLATACFIGMVLVIVTGLHMRLAKRLGLALFGAGVLLSSSRWSRSFSTFALPAERCGSSSTISGDSSAPSLGAEDSACGHRPGRGPRASGGTDRRGGREAPRAVQRAGLDHSSDRGSSIRKTVPVSGPETNETFP
jgi:hypothetical protein